MKTTLIEELKENNDIHIKSSFQENYGWQMNNAQVFDDLIEAKDHLSLWEYNIEKYFCKIEKSS